MPSTFITTLADHIKDHYDLKKEELTIVFPNKRAAFFLRSRFQEIFHEEIWLPQMLSIQEAMTQWSGIQLIDTVDMLFELISIDAAVRNKSTNIGIFGSMAAQMAKDFDEVDQYGVDARQLFSYVYEDKWISEWHVDGEITPKEKSHLAFFKSLEQYYSLLRQNLESQQKGYYGMITRFLANLDETQLLDCVGHRKVIFAGFNALTPTEQTVIDKLYKNGYAEVIWDFDHYYVDDENNPAGYFARSYRKKNLPWRPTNLSDSLTSRPKQIKLIAADGNSVQSKVLQSLLQVKNEDNAAVILADENLLVPVLNSIPERFSSLKISMGYPLRQTALNHLISAFFSLHRKGRKVRQGHWYLWPILRILDMELTQVIFSSQEIDSLNNYRSFVAEKTAFVFDYADFERYCSSPNLLKFIKLLLCDDIVSTTGLLGGLVALLAFIAERVQAHNEDKHAQFLLNQVSEAGKAVNRLNRIVTSHQHYVDTIEDLEVLYRLVSTNTSVKLNSSEVGGVQVMGLLEARNLDFDTFYMLGVNEGVLPAESKSHSFIPYSIRRVFELPTEQEKQAVYAYHFYRLLQGANTAYFIYNANNSVGSEPSRFLLQLKYELTKRNPLVQVSEEVFTPPAVINSQSERIVIHKTEPLMEVLMEKIQTTDLNKALAPTSISTYIKCPLKFCLHYLLKIKDNSAEENTPANVIGTVVHDTLQRIFVDYRGTIITPELFEQDIKSTLQKRKQQAIAKQFAHGLPDVGYNYLNQLVIEKMFDNWLHYEESDVGTHQIAILDLEHILHTTIEVGGVSCTIAGTADRIDKRDGIVRVIDYKTGLVKDKDVKVPKEVNSVADIPEKALQLLIYKYLYLKEHPEVTDPTMVTASLFVLKQKQVCLDLKVDYEPLNDDFITTMESLLGEVLTSMMDRETHFVQPDNSTNTPCHYCEFGQICVSTEAGASLEDDH